MTTENRKIIIRNFCVAIPWLLITFPIGIVLFFLAEMGEMANGLLDKMPRYFPMFKRLEKERRTK